jgi:coiled-coil domain-containing protein 12
MDIDWDRLDSIDRRDLQKLCKELKLSVKGNAKNEVLRAALREWHENQIAGSSASAPTDKPEAQQDKDEHNKTQEEDKQSIVPEQNAVAQQDTAERTQANDQEMKDVSDIGIKTEETDISESINRVDTMPENELESSNRSHSPTPTPTAAQTNTTRRQINDNDSTKESRLDGTHYKRGQEQEEQLPDGQDEVQYEGIKFRNYTPRDPKLKQLRMAPSSSQYPLPPAVADLTRRLQALEAQAAMGKAGDTTEDGMAALALTPRRPNWDLKRDVKPKLEKLERRTQRAIYELIKEKLQLEGEGEGGFARAVSGREYGFE